jgi:diguanylate cyclase (GGDEF)-like protein
MWNRLSLRGQLILLMGLLLAIIGTATLGAVNYFDRQERQVFAIDQLNTLTRSLNNDLLKAILSSDADTFADISFRISGYQSVDALTLYDNDGRQLLHFGRGEFKLARNMPTIDQPHAFTDSGHLYHRTPVTAEGQAFGETRILVSLDKYKTQVARHNLTLLLILPIELLIGLTMAWRISAGYTRPFHQLLAAMQGNDFTNNKFQRAETSAQNELRDLFDGYNSMLTRIEGANAELNYRSRHDSLTGLYNRYAIEDALKSCLKQENPVSHVLLSMDIDQFKLLNDSLGHPAGDELLQMFSQHCSHDLPSNGMIARVGGDDFYLLFTDTDAERGLELAKGYQQRFSDFRFFWRDQAVSVSASIGMVTFKPFEYRLEELVRAADLAFYSAKQAGRNKLSVYEPHTEQTKRHNTEVLVAGYLKEALASGPARFELYAQAIVPLQEQHDSIHYEVLLRMYDSDGNLLRPDLFLPTAARYQLMADIDSHVLISYLQRVSQNSHHLQQLGSAHINLSGTSLNNPDFQNRLKQAVNTFDFPWNKLELELTETSAVGNFSQAKRFIEYCQGVGIGFALDDFGTGMASFEYLKNLPFDVVKIDGSFIRNMHNDPVDHAMVSYTHEISKLRGQATVAEYVETAEDVETLRQIGITYGQGYFLGKPKPLTEWLLAPA